MAKLFPIGIEVEEVAVGSVLRILNKTPGVAKLHLNLLNEAASTVDNTVTEDVAEVRNTLPPVRQAKDGSSQMIVAQILRTAPVHNEILREALKRQGYSAASLASLITKMRENGFVKRVGVGIWKLTDKGSRHYFMKDVKTLPVRNKSNGLVTNNSYGVRGLVLTALNNGAQIVARDLRRILEENQYSPKNMTGTVSKMKMEGLLESKDGIYSLTERGRAVYDSEVAAKPAEKSLES